MPECRPAEQVGRSAVFPLTCDTVVADCPEQGHVAHKIQQHIGDARLAIQRHIDGQTDAHRVGGGESHAEKPAPVMPDIEDDVDIEIKDEDIRIDTYRASGAGGQHINKTSSAIRITHFPSGIVVQCQNERSQHMNKDKAMQMLKAKLYLLRQQENEEKLTGIRGEVTEIGWGNQIRSYVMQPYTMVKDHRTNEERGNVDQVMDGAIDPFINAYLRWIALGGK